MEFKKVTREWDTLKKDTLERKNAAAPLVKEGKIVDAKDTVALLEAVIKPFDKVNIEGNNQKQADFLAKALCEVDPAKIHDLHMVQSVLTLPEHLDVFEKGIAKKLDMSFSGPQAGRIAKFLQEGKLELGAIHTYLELYGRYFVDLTPRVALVAATMATCSPVSVLKILRLLSKQLSSVKVLLSLRLTRSLTNCLALIFLATGLTM